VVDSRQVTLQTISSSELARKMKKHLHIKRHEKVEKYQNIIFTSMAISRKYAISLLLCAQLTVNIARASGE
jgi:hypothetical protein